MFSRLGVSLARFFAGLFVSQATFFAGYSQAKGFSQVVCELLFRKLGFSQTRNFPLAICRLNASRVEFASWISRRFYYRPTLSHVKAIRKNLF